MQARGRQRRRRTCGLDERLRQHLPPAPFRLSGVGAPGACSARHGRRRRDGPMSPRPAAALAADACGTGPRCSTVCAGPDLVGADPARTRSELRSDRPPRDAECVDNGHYLRITSQWWSHDPTDPLAVEPALVPASCALVRADAPLRPSPAGATHGRTPGLPRRRQEETASPDTAEALPRLRSRAGAHAPATTAVWVVGGRLHAWAA